MAPKIGTSNEGVSFDACSKMQKTCRWTIRIAFGILVAWLGYEHVVLAGNSHDLAVVQTKQEDMKETLTKMDNKLDLLLKCGKCDTANVPCK